MKSLIILLLRVALFATLSVSANSAPTAAAPDDLRIVLTALTNPAHREEDKKTLLRLVLKDAPVGTMFSLIDGLNLKTISQFTIPELPFDSVEARKTALRSELGKLVAWYKANPEAGETEALRINDVLHRYGQNSGSNTRFIFWGSPLSPDLTTDGGQLVKLSRDLFKLDRQEHAFGTVGQRQLNGAAVYILYRSEDVFKDRGDSAWLEAFYADLCTKLDAHLRGFTSDRLGFFKTLSQPATEAPTAQAVSPKHIPTTSHTVFVVDRSGSMSGHLQEIGRRLASQNENPSNRYTLIILGDPADTDTRTTRTFSSPTELSSAFHDLPTPGGIDSMDALSTALLAAREVLGDYKVTGANVLIYADAIPVESSGRAKQLTYSSAFAQLIAEGHKPTFIPCEPAMDMAWLPHGVATMSF